MPHWLKLSSRGRGAGYSPLRGLVESLLALAYARDWPARAWSAIATTPVACLHHVAAVAPRGTPRLRLAFASDLHLGPTTAKRTLDEAFSHLRAAEADVLLLGGDFVFLEPTRAHLAELERRVREVPAKRKFAVLGNHDLWTDHPAIEAALARAGVEVLVNDARRLPAPYEQIAVVGIDDPWTGHADVDAALARAGGAALVLALSHSPDAAPLLEGRDVAMLLCGHTHGGQVALPGPRPIVVPGHAGKRWPFGRHEVCDLSLFVSRGVGGIEIPIRWNAPPDVLVIDVEEIRAEASAAVSRERPGAAS
jgi:hypothetical protein